MLRVKGDSSSMGSSNEWLLESLRAVEEPSGSDCLFTACDGCKFEYRRGGDIGVPKPCTPRLIFATEALVNQDIDGAAVDSRVKVRGTTHFEREFVYGVVYFGHCAVKLSI